MAARKNTTDRSIVSGRVDYTDGEPVEFVGATKAITTTWLAAGSEWIEGLKELTVTLKSPLQRFDLVGKVGTLTLSDGDTWPTFTPDGLKFVRSA